MILSLERGFGGLPWSLNIQTQYLFNINVEIISETSYLEMNLVSGYVLQTSVITEPYCRSPDVTRLYSVSPESLNISVFSRQIAKLSWVESAVDSGEVSPYFLTAVRK